MHYGIVRQAERGARSGGDAPDRAEHLVGLGEAALLVLGEDERAVDDDVEHAPSAVLEKRIVAELLLDGGRETRSPRLVVSDHAVLDDDVHRTPTMGPRGAEGKAVASV